MSLEGLRRREIGVELQRWYRFDRKAGDARTLTEHLTTSI